LKFYHYTTEAALVGIADVGLQPRGPEGLSGWRLLLPEMAPCVWLTNDHTDDPTTWWISRHKADFRLTISISDTDKRLWRWTKYFIKNRANVTDLPRARALAAKELDDRVFVYFGVIAPGRIKAVEPVRLSGRPLSDRTLSSWFTASGAVAEGGGERADLDWTGKEGIKHVAGPRGSWRA
jgi:hypothetical protein